jgi:hypothetical protein
MGKINFMKILIKMIKLKKIFKFLLNYLNYLHQIKILKIKLDILFDFFNINLNDLYNELH